VQLVRFDQVFGLSSGAIDLLIERLGQSRQIGDDEAAVGALGTGPDTGDNAALDFPACGGVAEFAVAADLRGVAVNPAERGILGEITDPAIDGHEIVFRVSNSSRRTYPAARPANTLSRVVPSRTGQELALFNAYYDSRCFQPIHI
jgi:hypothetical protein